MKTILSVLLIFTILTPYAHAGTATQTYEVPSVKDDFCGVHIGAFNCKCAFHNQCGDGMDSDSSYEFVLSEFREWNRQQIQTIGESCVRLDGHWDKNTWTCMRCTEGDVREGSRCVAVEKADVAAKECRDALKNIENDWEKYSDFDDRLGSDVGYEVQQFNEALDDIAELIAEAQEIEYQLAIAAEIRFEMRAYKAALVQNIRNNITKAI